MKKNIVLTLFMTVLSFILLSSAVLADSGFINFLTGVKVVSEENSQYTLNLIFKHQYKGNAFIQKQNPGSYIVFIPDTFFAKNKIKVDYANRSDKSLVKISAEEKPYIKNTLQSGYVKLNISAPKGCNINLSAQFEPEKSAGAWINNINKLFFFLLFLFVGIIAYIWYKLYDVFKDMDTSQSNIILPYDLNRRNKEFADNDFEAFSLDSIVSNIKETDLNQKILPKVNIRKNIKSSDSDSFDCFDIKSVNNNRKENKNIQSPMNKTSKVLSSNLKHSNPIQKTVYEKDSELSMPSVEDVYDKSKQEAQNIQKKAEVLSVLKITPTKGFYLSVKDDKFSLYGYVGKQIFLMKQFNDLSQINLQVRFYEKQGENELYILRLDSYRALVEISDTGIKELSVL